MNESRIILEMKNVFKQFNKNEGNIINDFSLTVNKGEIVGLIGESGSGKSTILRMISGLEVPSSGEIQINGNTVYGNGVFVEPERRNIGMVFQDYALFPHLTIRDNILYGLNKKKNFNKKEKLNEALKLIRLEGYENKYPHELSGGQRQRVALARALTPEPDILLMDEPFNSLDKSIQEEIRKEVYSLIKEVGITVVFVSHDISDAFYMTDRVVLIKRGISQQIGEPKELYSLPYNSYVCQFFGKTNIFSTKENVNLNGNEEFNFIKIMQNITEESEHKYILRPEDIVFTDNGGIPCKVIKHIHYGSHLEAELKPILYENNNNLTVLMKMDKNFDLKDGSSVKIKPKESSIKKIIN